MEILNATVDNIDQILKIEEEAFKDPRSKKDLLYEINENPFGVFLIAKEDNEIVGFYNFWITFDSATIYRIATLNSKKRLGIAMKLLKKGEEIMKSNNVEFLTLEVRVSNVPAISLYEKNGFNIITAKISYYDDGEDAYYMMKGLI